MLYDAGNRMSHLPSDCCPLLPSIYLLTIKYQLIIFLYTRHNSNFISCCLLVFKGECNLCSTRVNVNTYSMLITLMPFQASFGLSSQTQLIN